VAKPTQKTTVNKKTTVQNKPGTTTKPKEVVIQAKIKPTQEKPKEREILSITKNGASKEQNEWIKYAFSRCGLDCVTTWQAESGWVLERRGNTINANGTRDYGLCQMNSLYHSKWIFKNGKNGEFSEHFKNPYQQLDRCIGIWNDAKKRGRLKTTFYAYNVRNTKGVLNQFTIIYK